MKRLSSYIIYIGLIGTPVMIAFGVFTLGKKLFSEGLWFQVLIVIACYIFTCFKSKRVYVHNSSLLIRSLFSNKKTTVAKEQIVSIGPWIPFDPFSYKIAYIDRNNRSRTVYFVKELFILNMPKAISGLL